MLLNLSIYCLFTVRITLLLQICFTQSECALRPKVVHINNSSYNRQSFHMENARCVVRQAHVERANFDP